MKNQFGMFIHWGIYSLTGWQEQYQLRTKTSRSEYAKLKDRFNPIKYDPNQWVELAKEAGMKYICFTAKHHDGFCMWNTKYSDFNIMNTPYGKDTLKMLSEACKNGGIELSIYYSIPDACQINAYNPKSSHQMLPEFGDIPDDTIYRQYVKNQITELMSNYGKIYTLFWDIPPQIYDPSINEYVRSLQPDILINDRGYDKGDFSTPERNVPDGEMFAKPTEACQSVGKQSWGYRTDEDYYSYKFLTQSIDKIMLMGGSYLLNVGPDSTGTIPLSASNLVKAIGHWYNRISESFRNISSASEMFESKEFYAVKRDKNVYLHFNRDLQSCGISLSPLTVLPKSATVLNTLQPAKYAIISVPDDYDGNQLKKPCLRLFNLPVDLLCFEPIIIKLEF